jgi:hypothetical protein
VYHVYRHATTGCTVTATCADTAQVRSAPPSSVLDVDEPACHEIPSRARR